MNTNYITTDEFNEHIADVTKMIDEYHEALSSIIDAIKSLTTKINEHDEWLQVHNENFQML